MERKLVYDGTLFHYLLYSNDEDKNYGSTFLCECSGRGNVELVRLLLENGVDPNNESPGGGSPLRQAVRWNNVQVVKELVSHKKIDINRIEQGDTALSLATYLEHENIVNLLVEKGADVNLKEERANLSCSSEEFGTNERPDCRGKYPRGVYYLDFKNSCGDAPLHVATRRENLLLMRLFIEAGADINIKNALGHSPLWIAVCSGQMPIIKWLLEHGANINDVDNEGRSLLMLSVALGFHNVTKLLIFNGADPEHIDSKGHSICYWALFGKNHDLFVARYVFSLLLARGVSLPRMLNKRTLDGKTLLQIATSCKASKSVELLIDYGADVNVTDEHGDTPLHTALKLGCENIALLLMERGRADVNIANSEGEYPITLVRVRYTDDVNYIQLLKLLISRSNVGVLNTRNRKGQTMMHLAVYFDDIWLVNALIQRGVNVNLKDNEGRIPLDYVQSLAVRKAIEISSQQKPKKTPAHLKRL